MPKIKGPKAEREVLHPEVKVKLAVGDKAISVAQAKELLGWEEMDVKDDFCVPELAALVGKPVRMHNNFKNRYLTPAWLLTLKQEHLQRRWRFNGETVIIGRTGLVLSAQHRLISLILAETERQKDPKQWKRNWPGPVTMESLVVYGVDESDDVFKTFNCGKAATFSEFLYRSAYFEKYLPADRKELALTSDAAVKLLWARTGAKNDPYAPRRTHGEATDFLNRHKRLLEMVNHVFVEKSSKVVGPGPAAGLIYMMAASSSHSEKYAASPSESSIDFKNWDKATEFWTCLAGESPEVLQPILDALAELADPDAGLGASVSERLAVLIKAWNKFEAGKPICSGDLALKYVEDRSDSGSLLSRRLTENPVVGGIDFGGVSELEADEAHSTPVKEAVEQRKLEIRKEKVAADVSSKAGTPMTVEALRKRTLPEQLEDLKNRHGNKVLLFARPKTFALWGEDATFGSQKLRIEMKFISGLNCAEFPARELKNAVSKLKSAGQQSLVCVPKNGIVEVYDPDEWMDTAEAVKVVVKPKLKKAMAK